MKILPIALSALLLAACSGGPSEAEVEQQIVAHELKGMNAKVLDIDDFEKVNSYKDTPNTRVVEVSYDVVFKIGVDEIDTMIKEARLARSASAWTLARYATDLQGTYGYKRKGDKVHMSKEYRFRETDNGWQMTRFDER